MAKSFHMDKFNSITHNNKKYYSVYDFNKYAPTAFKGCRRFREIIKKQKIPKEYYLYATVCKGIKVTTAKTILKKQ